MLAVSLSYNELVRFIGSADRHEIAHVDAEWVVDHPYLVVTLRDDPLKKLYIGFDQIGRPLEIVTDT
jgi:hypothetical protein